MGLYPEVFLTQGQTLTGLIRWDDTWGSAARDFDLFLYDSLVTTVLASSQDAQWGDVGQSPREWFEYTAPTTGTYRLAIRHISGTTPQWLQMLVFGASIGTPIPARSVSSPAESANPGMLAVGAAYWATPDTIEDFSSQGPTIDGRTKPDIVGADRGDSATKGPNGFSGTSQASPHVAGLAALVIQQFPSFTPAQIASYLKTNAAPRGAVPNNTWGFGFARLPSLPPGPATNVTAAAGNGQASVDWNAPTSDGGSPVLQYTVTSDPGSLTAVTQTAAADGSLDTTFGTDGYVLTDFGSIFDAAQATATQSDGKIVVAGYTGDGSDLDWALVRYNVDESLDTGFGTDGKVTKDFNSGDDRALALAVLMTGKILVAGFAYNGTDFDFGLVRYNSDGSLDTSFGTNGTATTGFDSWHDLAWALTVQDDGKILVAGYAWSGSSYDFAVVRYGPGTGA